ncbi:caffeic acid 3-O-methyltransferase-like [Dorcoceras hygrometricum]|uniref:Caffeic acid 3-O-methyltransferase-like n=1 Tax=Dorcoceras hygrometricum TaxID=472368 RepID=A0A2Z7CWC8_9LAMI|nr:caffeic acid 3-O-methyltransferase-like [Dorcoceras hygrometricum]
MIKDGRNVDKAADVTEERGRDAVVNPPKKNRDRSSARDPATFGKAILPSVLLGYSALFAIDFRIKMNEIISVRIHTINEKSHAEHIVVNQEIIESHKTRKQGHILFIRNTTALLEAIGVKTQDDKYEPTLLKDKHGQRLVEDRIPSSEQFALINRSCAQINTHGLLSLQLSSGTQNSSHMIRSNYPSVLAMPVTAQLSNLRSGHTLAILLRMFRSAYILSICS